MLLASHAFVTTVSLGHAVFEARIAGPVAIRHVNFPALIRTAHLAVRVLADRKTRQAAAIQSWTELLHGMRNPGLHSVAEQIDADVAAGRSTL